MKLIGPNAVTKERDAAPSLCLARRVGPFAIEESIQALSRNISAVEAGASVIDRGFPVPGLGSADLIAADSSSRPVVVCVGERADMQLLCRGLALADWISENLEIVRRLAGGRELSGEPRVWLVAGELAPEAGVLMRRLGEASPEIFVCRDLSIDGERRLVLQKAGTEPAQVGAPAAVAPVKIETATARRGLFKLPMKSILTEEEIEGFMGGNSPKGSDEDEVTSWTRHSV
ncbi:MAG TPA: hypothetical protein PLY45_05320 [bacterium]|nr:hypothetical protein [bacterium]